MSDQSDAAINGGEIGEKILLHRALVHELSAHQLDDVHSRNSNASPGQAERAATRTLGQIIDQELLARKALEARLDRDRQVMQAIEDAKRQILAQAYIERAVVAASSIDREDIKTFYKENPALFERRRIYRLLELAVVAPPEQVDALTEAAADAKSPGDVARWLNSRKLPFSIATKSRPAEQIPMKILRQVSEMRDGQFTVFRTARGASVVHLVQSTVSPLSEQQATPMIERYLLIRKRIDIAQAELRKLREQAKLEYGPAEPVHPKAVAQSAARPQSDDGKTGNGQYGK
ncbi:MAG TPA: EpsD family peptidyl-prolyl cis-trans isomerase [Burkholderiales bacterium]|nr:EpsD family peptidyl-prolyl cis-trans isomerase [Burkholderiales bacterium]